MIAVHIATYGTDDWSALALARAYPSAQRNEPDEIIVHHDPGGTIATARNNAAKRSIADWLIYLDADDELGPGYVKAMAKMIEGHPDPMMLFTPMVSYVIKGRVRRPMFWPQVNLQTANWLIIGTVVHRSLFNLVGGFEEWPHGIEDFNLWSRCHKAGARVAKVPRAIYYAHRNDQSQHHLLMRDPKTHEQWRLRAVASVYPELAE